ncbi:MAG: excinuclease ABC subunit UvrC [Clostridiaceae bacterium]|nr:excinuclease ABC subunit UvrC [Clostridiaceae bacterium]
MDKIKEILQNLPDSPGVYLMKDKTGKIIYVGKAKILKNRVRQYFQNTEEKDPKTRALVSKIHNIETIITKTEAEALILENTLIKLHKPRYNILLKDDKTYPYICVAVQDPFPGIFITRLIKKDGARYFGAYTKLSDARKTIELLRRIFPIRTCKRNINSDKPQRPCLYYHIKLCSAPCAGKIDKAGYDEIVKEACRFLEGKHEDIVDSLKEKMQKASDEMDFEKAASIRDKIRSLQNVTAKQLVLSTKMEDRDLCALVRDEINSIVVVLFVRGGKLMGKYTSILEQTYDLSDGDVMEIFTTQFYGNGREVPPEILLTHEPSDREMLEQWLRNIRGRSVRLHVPLMGDKKHQIDLAVKNAKEEYEKYKSSYLAGSRNVNAALEKLAHYLNTEVPPHRIEAYDISNIGSSGMVAGMVVFVDGKAATGQYRKFKIKNVDNQNDYASMQEVLYRRLKRLKEESSDRSFGERPDLILVDGGMGHYHAAKEVIDELDLNIPVLGMAKDDRHKTSSLVSDSIDVDLKEEPALISLIALIQGEAHRYAITFHRKTRQKAQRKSLLDNIPGIGPQRKKALLKEFGSVKRIREADEKDLCRVEGINEKLAKEVKRVLENGW